MNIRNILTIIIAGLLLSLSNVVVESAEPREEQAENRETSTQQKTTQSTERENDTETLDFSGTGRPGQQTAGESRGTCDNAVQPIKAVLPESNTGKTVLGYPSFWVYFPELLTKTAEVEFIIQDESRTDIWRSRSPLNSTTGYQSFTLPKTEQPLEIDQWYRWYIKVYCNQQMASFQYVQGWVQRISLTSELYLELEEKPQQDHHLVYGNHLIWYDAMDRLLSLYRSKPHSITLEQDWQNLTRAKGVELEHLPSLGGNKTVCQQNQLQVLTDN